MRGRNIQKERWEIRKKQRGGRLDTKQNLELNTKLENSLAIKILLSPSKITSIYFNFIFFQIHFLDMSI
jgi:hypothetical protein